MAVGDTVDVATMTNALGGPGSGLSLEELAVELTARAGSAGVSLMLEAVLEAEMAERVGYAPYDPAGNHSGISRDGTRPKTALTEIGPVQFDVPRGRGGTFEPHIVLKRALPCFEWVNCPN